jgi:hypothetical protein
VQFACGGPFRHVDEHHHARVAELADAPDLGFQNRRFQNIPCRFKKRPIFKGKTPD